jgi:hypothetical protein
MQKAETGLKGSALHKKIDEKRQMKNDLKIKSKKYDVP